MLPLNFWNTKEKHFMRRINWFAFKAEFNNWVRCNSLPALDIKKTLLCMQNSIFTNAPHSTQPAFVDVFGEIDEKYLTENIAQECSDMRKAYGAALQTQKTLKLNPKRVRQAVELTNDSLGLGGKTFTRATIIDAAERLPRTTSSVAPDYVRPKVLLLPRVIAYIENIFSGAMRLPAVKDFWPITIFWRTQMRAGGERHRIIAGFPQAVSLMEMIFFKPFFDHFDDNVGKTWYSYSSSWQENSKVWKDFQKYRNIVEIDYTRFDMNVPGELLSLFYENFGNMLKLSPSDRKIFNWVKQYHLHAVVLNSCDRKVKLITEKKNSVLSGSVVTSLADSWINAFTVHYTCLELGISREEYDARVMGDDTVLANNEDGNQLLDAFSTTINRLFGMKVSDKSKVIEVGLPFFYMGFLTNDTSKVMDEQLLIRKLILTGRFISPSILENDMVVWSKFCSICASCSNGYAFWLKHKAAILRRLNLVEPHYFHDFEGGPDKSFDPNRIINNAAAYVEGAWRYT
jgi:hypothetical protein